MLSLRENMDFGIEPFPERVRAQADNNMNYIGKLITVSISKETIRPFLCTCGHKYFRVVSNNGIGEFCYGCACEECNGSFYVAEQEMFPVYIQDAI